MGTLLYDGATGFISASPGLSGLGIPGVRQLAYGQLPPLPQLNSVGTPTLNTNLGAGNTGYAGYTNYDPLSAQSTFSLINPASFPTLNRTTGFTVSFNVAVTAETSNPNRAGFSVTVMSSDGAGIELGFKEEGANDRIFAQSADFIESEFITTNINAASTYVLTILDNSYTLSNGTQTLTGSLRNYNFNPLTSAPPLPFNPYISPNFLFFGDNTDQGNATFTLGSISVNLAIADSNDDPNPAPTQTNTWDFVSIDYNLDGATDIMALNKSGTASGKTEVHIMDGAIGYQSWALQTSTVLHETDNTWEFGKGDFKGDGHADIVSIKKSNTGTGSTEIHIMNAADNYQSWLLQTGTILHETGDNFEFQTGDYNGDGHPDIFAIKKSETGTNSTEFHILDGATNYQSWLLQTGTALHETGDNWDFQVGDYNGDSLMDIFGVKQSATDSNSTEIHILDGASNYQAFSLQTSTVLGMTGDNWSFAMGNNNLISLNQGNTGTGTTEVHILDASTNYQSWLIQTGTVLHEITPS